MEDYPILSYVKFQSTTEIVKKIEMYYIRMRDLKTACTARNIQVKIEFKGKLSTTLVGVL
jgi:hypothetical protein